MPAIVTACKPGREGACCRGATPFQKATGSRSVPPHTVLNALKNGTAGTLKEAGLAGDTPLPSDADLADILGVLEAPLARIGRRVLKEPSWPAHCCLPEPFLNWRSAELFCQFDGLEPAADGRAADEMFVDWLHSLAESVEQTVDDILSHHADARGS
jgi:hypothetical protein